MPKFNGPFSIKRDESNLLVSITTGEIFTWVANRTKVDAIVGTGNRIIIGTEVMDGIDLDFTQSTDPGVTGGTLRSDYIDTILDLVNDARDTAIFVSVTGGAIEIDFNGAVLGVTSAAPLEIFGGVTGGPFVVNGIVGITSALPLSITLDAGSLNVTESFPILKIGGGADVSFERFIGITDNQITGFNNSVGNTNIILSPAVPINGVSISFPLGTTTLGIASTSTDDTAAGTGARSVEISGLDASYLEITETVVLSGNTKVTTSSSFLRINKVRVVTTGTTGENQGDIYISSGDETFTAGGLPTTKLFTSMDAFSNISKTMIFTVPSSKILNVINLNIASNATEGNPALLKIFTRNNSIPLPKILIVVLPISSGVVTFPLDGTDPLPAKSDIWLEAQKTGGTNRSIFTSFHAYLRDNTTPVTKISI